MRWLRSLSRARASGVRARALHRRGRGGRGSQHVLPLRLTPADFIYFIHFIHFTRAQVLRYSPGAYYRSHHDWVDAHIDFPFGPRVFTFFLYLSDVEVGQTLIWQSNDNHMFRSGRSNSYTLRRLLHLHLICAWLSSEPWW